MNPNERTSTNPAIAAAADAAGEVVGMATGRMPEMLQDCDRRLSRALSNTSDARLHAREAAAGVTACRAEQRGASEWVCDCTQVGPGCKPTGWRAAGAKEVAPVDPQQAIRLAEELEALNLKLHGGEHNAHRPAILCGAAALRWVAARGVAAAPAPGMRVTEDTEAAFQRGKRAGYSEGFRAGRDGVLVVDDQPNGPQSPLAQKEGPA